MVVGVGDHDRGARRGGGRPRGGDTPRGGGWRRAAGLLAAVLLLATAGCAGSRGGAPATDAPEQVTLGLTYVPNVQFAPFYVAAEQGYFDDAGVDVELRHHGESEDLFGALQSGDEQVVVAGGDEMMQARSQGTPVLSIATLYRRYPVVAIVPADSPVTEPKDLAGKKIGVPGPYGETWFGLLALLDSAGLTQDDVTIENIGFTQQAALTAGHVDVAMGFANGDVPALESSGFPVRSLPVGTAEQVPLAGIGLGTTDAYAAEHPEALRAVNTAVGRAVADLLADPGVGLEASKEYIPGTLDEQQERNALATLDATVELYEGEDPVARWGEHDAGVWGRMSDFLLGQGLIETAVDAEEAHTDDFLG